ncbi:MAG: hypothetical protein GQ532_19375, partial [Methylomarinum sp.]|nr:hypothetical protein [Methylomarinum sp.]
DCWTTYHIRRKCISNQKQPVPTIGASESVSISDDEGYIWQTEALGKIENEETDCTPGHVINSDNRTANDVRIPAGEHIVFVGVDGNTSDGKIERKDLNGDGDYDDLNEFDELRDQAILKVIPRFTQPIVTLVIQ